MKWQILYILCVIFSQEIASQVVPDCTVADILSQQLGNCRCGGGHNHCTTQCPAGPPFPGCSSTYSQSYLNDCPSACGSDQNQPCDGCWIWFNALCSCLQNAGSCLTSKTNPPYWVLLNPTLITASILIPDILDLQEHHGVLRDAVWEFGQTVYIPGTQALAINPAHSKTQDQVHMHVCPANSAVKNGLTTLSTTCVTCYSNLTPVNVAGISMWCRAEQAKASSIDGVSDDIDKVLAMHGVCPYFVGAAVVRDGNGYTWSCVTADNQDTEHRVCY